MLSKLKQGLIRFSLVLVALSFGINSVALPVKAAPLPPSEVKALSEYANWVANVCPNGEAAGAGGSLTGSTVQEQLFNYFVSNGLDPIHAAAILGNIAHEGVFDPTSVENVPGSGLPATSQNPAAADPYGYGIIGWTPGSSLLVQLKELGITDPPYTVLAQAEVIVGEINGKTPDYYAPSIGQQFLNTKTIEDAVTAYQGNAKTGGPYLGFERPADEAGSLPDRIASAKHFLSEFGSGTVSPPTGGGGTPTTGPNCSCPSGSGGGTTTGTLSGNTPAEQAFNYYVGKGLSDQAAAGLVGNFMAESGGDTENLDPSITNGIGAHGIAQWLGTRLTDLQNFASSHHENEDALTTQLDFSWSELNGGYRSVLAQLKTVSTPEKAADIVNSNGPPTYGGGYEGSGVAPTSREINAKKIFSKYGGGAGGGGSTGTGSSCAPTTGGTGTYQNPFSDWKGIVDNRVDQGVDYSGVGPIHPIGNATIDISDTSSGWPGGNFISYKLLDGPAQGKEVYVAEDCKIASGMTHGKSVTPSDTLCTTTTAGGYIYIETGWAAPGIDNSIDTVKQPGCYDINNSKSTAYGMNFRQLLGSLGVSINNEIDKPIVCSLPSGWPTW